MMRTGQSDLGGLGCGVKASGLDHWVSKFTETHYASGIWPSTFMVGFLHTLMMFMPGLALGQGDLGERWCLWGVCSRQGWELSMCHIDLAFHWGL